MFSFLKSKKEKDRDKQISALRQSQLQLKLQRIQKRTALTMLMNECGEIEERLKNHDPVSISIVEQKTYDQQSKIFTRTMNSIDDKQNEMDKTENELRVVELCLDCVSAPSGQNHLDKLTEFLKKHEDCASIVEYINKYKARTNEMNMLYNSISNMTRNVDEMNSQFQVMKNQQFCRSVDQLASECSAFALSEVEISEMNFDTIEIAKSFVESQIHQFV